MIAEKITGLSVQKSDYEGTEAYGTITVADVFKIRFNVKRGKNGLFVLLPGYKNNAGKWVASVDTTNKAATIELQKMVLDRCKADLNLE